MTPQAVTHLNQDILSFHGELLLVKHYQHTTVPKNHQETSESICNSPLPDLEGGRPKTDLEENREKSLPHLDVNSLK